MKKIIPVLLVMILFLSGCSGMKKNPLESNDWKFSRIVAVQTGVVVFSSEKDSSKYNTAKTADFSFTANESKMTIKDNASGNEWTLDYIINETAEISNRDGTVYDITYTTEEKTVKGFATTGIANLNDVSEYNYLIITLGGYELYFNDMEEIRLG